jgi:signal transduction histidine kinase/ActR/RegA family two-component response regulator
VLVTSHARHFQSLVEDNAIVEMNNAVAQAVLQEPEVRYGVFVSDRGQVLAYGSPAAQPHVVEPGGELVNHDAAEVARALKLRVDELGVSVPIVRELEAFGEPIIEFGAPVSIRGEYAGTLRYGISTAKTESALAAARHESTERTKNAALAVFAVVVLTVVVGAILASRIARRISGPIVRLTHAARALSLGRRNVQVVEVTTNDEVATLGRAFNRMVEELDASYAALEERNRRVTREIEERRRAEQEREEMEGQLIRAQKMEAFGQVAGGVAHDFNNILAVVMGQSEFVLEALDAGGADPALREDVAMILEAGGRGANLTRQLLAFARREVTHPRVVRLAGLIRAFEPLLRRVIEESIQIEITCKDEDVPVRIDPGRFEQVLMNLAVNARDAMPHGGRLTISSGVEVLEQPRATGAGVAPAGHYAVLRVTDTGTGMRPEVRERVFEPFFTTKSAGLGTGLGLATVYGIVRDASGTIELASEEGVGTSFSIRLPVAAEAPDAVPDAVRLRTVAGQGRLVVVCEDELSVRKLTTRILREAGYEVRAASTAEDALAAIVEAERPISLLVTDVVMPSINGPELVRRLERTHPSLPVLYTSGYTDDLLGAQSLEGGTRRLLRKPFRASELLDAVAQLLADVPAATAQIPASSTDLR